MNFDISTKNSLLIKSDLAVLFVENSEEKKTSTKEKKSTASLKISSLLKEADQKMGGQLLPLLKKEKFEGKKGQTKLINTFGKLPASSLLIVGMGKFAEVKLNDVRHTSAKIGQIARQIQATTLVCPIVAEGEGDFTVTDGGSAVAEGLILSGYKFERYTKKKPNKKSTELEKIIIPLKNGAQKNAVQKGADVGAALSKGVTLARDLVNTPANDMTPLLLAKAARNLPQVKTQIRDLKWIKKMKMGAYLGVSQGSIHPPAFIEMHYKPTGKARKTIAIIGKGVTFDSGGLSLKPPKYMETMKDDMSGGAAVIGLMSIISKLKPSVEVWGFVAATENMPDAMAIRPGDVITAMNGKTIEVLNTDAEGRLTLADACHYANSKKPDYMIDLATLTGACLVALGDRISAILGNDPELVSKLIDCSKKTGEKLWELPLAEEYKEELKSPIADLKNIGGNYGGTLNGGLFIQEFVGKTKWAHLDIAGPAWTERTTPFEARGGTGVMVRTLAEFLNRF